MRAIWVAVGLLLAACASPSAPVETGSQPASTPRPPVVGLLDLPSLPGAAASGPDGLWIADYDRGNVTHVVAGGSKLSASVIHVGDPRSLQPGCQAGSVHYAPTGSFIIRRCDLPAGMADGAGAVWTGRNDEQAVLRIDPRQGRVVATIPVGMHVFSLAAWGNEVVVDSYEDNMVAGIDARSNQVLWRETVLHSPSGIAFAGGSVWIALTGGFAVARLDPQTGSVLATVPVGKKPFPVVGAEGAVWVRCEQDSTLWRIDTATDQASAGIPVDPFYGNDGLDSAVAAGDGVWISGLSVQRIDSSGRTGGSLPLPGRPYAASGGRIWVIGVGGRVYLAQLPG